MDISWIDEFVRRIRPYVYVRGEDRLLIKKPNIAYKLNHAGIEVLDFLLNQGGTVAAIVRGQKGDDSVPEDLNRFFQDLSLLLEGQMGEFYRSPTVERVPFKLGYNTLPVISEVAVTYRCNLKCRFCYAGCGTCLAVPHKAEMDLGEIKRVLEIIYREAQAPTVSFTGGEPLVRTDLPEMVACAKELGFRVNLITNGTLAEKRMVDELRQAGLDSAQVSIEGSNGNIHDSITGVPGSFEGSLAGITNFMEAGITVHHHTTMNRLNFNDLTLIPRLARSLGLERLSMNLVIPTGTAALHRDIVIKYSEVGDKVLAVKMAAAAEGVEFLWYSPTPLCIFNPILHGLGNKGCSACDGLISIAPDGQLLPCSSFDNPLGSLLEVPFRELWDSEEAVAFRRKFHAPSFCHECDRLDICNGGCPIYFKAMGYAELEERSESLMSNFRNHQIG
jgi:radical SAM protein with 4Fe4S-binding SPASM domain